MQQIIGSVGLGGQNRSFDVLVVQRLLANAGVSPGPIDQRCGSLTIRAIEDFQDDFLCRPDGRVDVGGPTWRHLELATRKPVQRHPGTPRALISPHSALKPAPPRVALRVSNPVVSAHAPSTSISRDRRDSRTYWQTITPLVPRNEVNQGLQSPANSLLLSLLGSPTGAKTESRIVTAHAGPLHVTGLRPAIESLAAILSKVHRDLPDLYGLLATPGMRAVRNVRGHGNLSNHSWGIAIDIKVGSVLVPLGSPFSIKGIDALVPYFNAAGWYWGGGYHGRKDPMHFECSGSLLRSFAL